MPPESCRSTGLLSSMLEEPAIDAAAEDDCSGRGFTSRLRDVHFGVIFVIVPLLWLAQPLVASTATPPPSVVPEEEAEGRALTAFPPQTITKLPYEPTLSPLLAPGIRSARKTCGAGVPTELI